MTVAEPISTIEPVETINYLGCYVEGTILDQAKARGFAIEQSSRFLVLHDRQLIQRSEPIQMIWQFPDHLESDCYLKLFGRSRNDQISLILEDWQHDEDNIENWDSEQDQCLEPTYTEQHEDWTIGIITEGKGRSARLKQIQISNADGTWFKNFDPIQGTKRNHFDAGRNAIALVESTLQQIPDIDQLNDIPTTEEAVLDTPQIPSQTILGIPRIEPMTKRISLSEIVADPSTQARSLMNGEVICDYSEGYAQGESIPALKVKFDGTNYYLYDGFHRLAGARGLIDRADTGSISDSEILDRVEVLKTEGLLCEISSGTLEDAQWECLFQNVNHGLRRSRSDIPRIVELTLKHPYAKERSYRELATQVKLDPKTFKAHWQSLADSGKVPPPPDTITVTRSGQGYQMERTGIGRKSEDQSSFLHGTDSNRVETSTTPTLKVPSSPQNQSADQEHSTATEAQTPVAPTILKPQNYVEEPTSEATLTVKESNEKYTPRAWRDFAELVFGEEIDLDPASSEIANQVIKARRIFTIEQNGLEQDWTSSTLWLNPPYSMPEVAQFSEKLLSQLPEFTQAIVLVNACTETEWFQKLAATCDRILFPNQRINFWSKNDDPDNFKGQNEYRQALLYWGHRTDVFQLEGSKRGFVVLPLKP